MSPKVKKNSKISKKYFIVIHKLTTGKASTGTVEGLGGALQLLGVFAAFPPVFATFWPPQGRKIIYKKPFVFCFPVLITL
jgi:hypothetical protein